MGGMFGNRGNTESREQTIANGKQSVLTLSFCTPTFAHSESEDTTSRNRSQAIGSRLPCRDTVIHPRGGAQIYKGAEEHERRGCMPIRCVQTEGDAELHAD